MKILRNIIRIFAALLLIANFILILSTRYEIFNVRTIKNTGDYMNPTIKDGNLTTKNSLKNINDIEGKVVLVINKEVMMLYIITIALVCLLLVSDMFITLSSSTETNPL